MSRYRCATWKPLSGTSTARLTKDILCFHTCVGSATGTWNYFEDPDVSVYSHGVIGGIWGGDAGKNLDGVAWQMADTDVRAAANLNGNWRVISWETADNAARPIAAWTPKQCTKIVQVIVEAHQVDGVPLAMIPDTKPGRRGVAYHRLGCNPYRASGGELWSSANGKDCPTDVRIRQLPALIERARNIVNGGTDKQEELSIMDAETQAYLDRRFLILEEKLNRTGGRLADMQKEGLDGRALILKAFELLDPAGVSDAELRRMGAIVAEAIPGATADEFVDALAARPLTIGAKPAA